MASPEESLFITQFLAAFEIQPTKFAPDFVAPGMAPSWTSKRATFERPPKPVKEGAAQGEIELVVKGLKSGKWNVKVSAQGTIAELKEAVAAESGIEVAAQRLVLKGKALVDTKSLEEYGLAAGSVVHLIAKGGATGTSEPSSAAASTATSPAIGSAPASGTSTVEKEAVAAAPKRPTVTSYRGLSEAGTEAVKEAEFWYWLNDQLRERLGSKEDASMMMKGFIGQYRDLIGNAGTKEIESSIKK
ncbi:ubiquitin-like protein 4 [Entomortierella parvispora]|uniref:Ubiquitin-like protein 4 n=1 Tax=Entomortierella parvispora TaxID=205924 RepID=A0A9P3H5F9_9FUNG|nr:ubiquitin-like protein 4 [Entomortierella parvispora]